MRNYEIIPYSHRQQYAMKKELGRLVGVQSGSGIIDPYSHRQNYSMKKVNNLSGIQAGSGWTDALSKAVSVAGKIASNKAVQNIGKASLEVGTTLAGTAIANKLANSGHPVVGQALQNIVTDPNGALSNLLQERDAIKERYKNGSISKAEAITLIKKIDQMRQSGGVKALKSHANRQYKGGNIMSIRPVRNSRQIMNVDPIIANTSSGLTPQVGGIAPLAIPLVAGGIGILSSMLGPIIERISGKYVASKI